MATQHYKYPRTPHLPWSPGAASDDLILARHTFEGCSVVVTEKLDGENTTMYLDHIHARSLDSSPHPSRTWVKALHGSVAHLIPEGWRLCGENVYAQHSIAYQNLKNYFYLFSVWDETNTCLSWQSTREWAELLGLELVPVLYEGVWDEARVRSLKLDFDQQEGYVVRNQDAFTFEEFARNTAKWVRQDHVQTSKHWLHSAVTPNGLAES